MEDKWDDVYFGLKEYLKNLGIHCSNGEFLLNEGVLKVDCGTRKNINYPLDLKKIDSIRFRAKNNKKNRQTLLEIIKELHPETKELKLSIYTQNNTIVEIEYLIKL